MQIAQDPSLSDGIKSLVETSHTNVVAATAQTIETFANIFLGMEDPYMRERGADIKILVIVDAQYVRHEPSWFIPYFWRGYFGGS